MSEGMRRRLQKCEALADDPRALPEIAATARRQAAALREQLRPIDWSTRHSSEAAAAGVTGRPVLCRDGWFVPATQE